MQQQVPVGGGSAARSRILAAIRWDGMPLSSIMRSIIAWVRGPPLPAADPGRPPTRVWLTEDAMGACVSGPDGLTVDDLGERLREIGIAEVDDEVLVAFLAAGRDGVVLSGRCPVPSVPGRIRLFVDLGLSIGAALPGDGTDWRERGFGRADVAVGDTIARVERARPGIAGWDLLGRELPVEEVQDARLEAGEGVTELAGARFVASQEGRVSLVSGCVSVVPVQQILGDVGYQTGHIDLPMFGVSIGGNIEPGFRVHAGGPIEVRGTVDNAELVSRARVDIHGGLISRGGGSVWSCGPITVQHAQNAELRAVGGVVVKGALMHCDVATPGEVRAKRILGGSTTAGTQIVAQEVGATGGVPTRLEVGAYLSAIGHIEEQVAHLAKRLDATRIRVGEAALPLEGVALVRMIESLRAEADRIRVDPAHHMGAQIRVEGTVHVGVEVVIADASLLLERPRSRCVFRYQDGVIQCTPLLSGGSDG
jgi:uncharacterized protein